MIENCIRCNTHICNEEEGARYKKDNGLIFYICDDCAYEAMVYEGADC